MFMTNYIAIVMLISLDTNVWIFGILGSDPYCEKILLNLSHFNVVVPNQVRLELERNISNQNLNRFYYFADLFDVVLNYERVPEIFIAKFEAKGLKKGDAVIGGFSHWQKIDVFVSDNRDFLRGLSAGHYFQVMSPKEFCQDFTL